jgi:hypothetical protein
MMTVKLTDDQWRKILPVLKTCPQIRLKYEPAKDRAEFLKNGLTIGKDMLGL